MGPSWLLAVEPKGPVSDDPSPGETHSLCPTACWLTAAFPNPNSVSMVTVKLGQSLQVLEILDVKLNADAGKARD